MLASPVSDGAVQGFYEHRTLKRGEREYIADYVIGHSCFAYELVYPNSLRRARLDGYALKMLEKPFTNEKTREVFAGLRSHMEAWMDEQLTNL